MDTKCAMPYCGKCQTHPVSQTLNQTRCAQCQCLGSVLLCSCGCHPCNYAGGIFYPQCELCYLKNPVATHRKSCLVCCIRPRNGQFDLCAECHSVLIAIRQFLWRSDNQFVETKQDLSWLQITTPCTFYLEGMQFGSVGQYCLWCKFIGESQTIREARKEIMNTTDYNRLRAIDEKYSELVETTENYLRALQEGTRARFMCHPNQQTKLFQLGITNADFLTLGDGYYGSVLVWLRHDIIARFKTVPSVNL